MFRQTLCSKLFQNLETKLPLPSPRLGLKKKKRGMWVIGFALVHVMYLSLSATYLVCLFVLQFTVYIVYNV
jgi:hypothetical protein